MNFHYIYFSLILSLLFGCQTSDKNNQAVFRYNESNIIGSLDPAFSRNVGETWLANQLFNGLVQTDDSLNTLPCIAKNWSISEDGLTYTFNLRNDIYFHKSPLFGSDSTRTVTAEDFVYSFNRLKDKSIASPGSWVLNKVNDFKAINDTIFEIQLNTRFPAFLGLMTMKYCSVVPHEVVNHYGNEFRSHPIGTGPFSFKRWEENIKLVLRRNNSYFEYDQSGKQLPYLEAVSITFLPDKQSEFLQFAQGKLDFLNSLDASYKDEILTTKGELRSTYAKNVNMLRGPYLNTEYLGFYLDADIPEIQSEALRKAVNYGFDRTKMMIYLRNGVGVPAHGGMIPKGLPGYKGDIGFSYQPEKAKQLVEQFKKETNIQTPEITISTTSNYLNFCEYIQRELGKIGILVNVDVLPSATLRDARNNGKLGLFRASWVADYLDAENYLGLFYSQTLSPNGSNYTHFKSAAFDSLYNASFAINDIEKRKTLYTQMDSLVMQQAPIVPLYYDEVIRFTQKNVSGLGINPVNQLDLRKVKKN
ncbi:ABC transporter substrate-binding protein [Mangrovimonas sp. TPBH4]|uniref:ABC transporter substrate-binding protein n=1 Tax=Mangrovimonas sp. TPBH4 TaxID=1645914 RepID=UPI0006B64743|nr:ABC transporter substrate-binding protein [Mangrovimonas sp. TPBH4]